MRAAFQFLGIPLGARRSRATAPVISDRGGTVTGRAIRTDEEVTIAGTVSCVTELPTCFPTRPAHMNGKSQMANGRLIQRFAAGGACLGGMVQWMTGLETLEESKTVFAGLLFCFALGAPRLWQVPSAVEWQSFHRAGPARELAGAGLGQRSNPL